jgi:predicted small metal-binding protein
VEERPEEEVVSGKIIECPCGTVLRGDDDEAVVAAAQAHAKTIHDMDLSDEQAQSMVAPN